jgi:hypothetical protein
MLVVFLARNESRYTTTLKFRVDDDPLPMELPKRTLGYVQSVKDVRLAVYGVEGKTSSPDRRLAG